MRCPNGFGGTFYNIEEAIDPEDIFSGKYKLLDTTNAGSVLHCLAYYGEFRLFSLMLKIGANPLCENSEGDDIIEYLELLINDNRNVEQCKIMKQRLLNQICKNGNNYLGK